MTARPAAGDETSLNDHFIENYRLSTDPLLRSLERQVCGCAYGSESYTTREEADALAACLALRPGVALLELGAGAGWPGLYFAEHFGCSVTLADLPVVGLSIAANRALEDSIESLCRYTAADGTALPFADGSFDAISHSDVLCCLDDKVAVLSECRRVLRPGGKMVFTVVATVDGLAAGAQNRVEALGPPYVEAVGCYPGLLETSGWSLSRQEDWTAGYRATAKRRLESDEAEETALRDLLGTDKCSERLAADRGIVSANHEGLYCRAVFEATPV